MKSIQKVLSIIFIMIVYSCSNDDGLNQLGRLDEPHDNSEITTRSNQNPMYNIPIYSQTELVVQYKLGVDDVAKATLRSIYEVIYYEICQLCPDKYIELWGFDPDIQIEPRKHAIETTAIGIKGVNYQFTFTADTKAVDPGTWEDTSYEPLIVSDNSGITIAVLDTGFDPFFPFWYDSEGLPIPMLYNASETADGDELSGWDFSNSDPNPFDDTTGKHGSAVTYEIFNILSNSGVPFQILPVKIFNEFDETNYFNVLCGTYYAIQRAQIINMSFGWFEDGIGDYESTLLRDLLGLYSEVIIVSSAGNGNGFGDEDPHIGDDNDDHFHYPSSYEVNNMIAVAATNKKGTSPASWSNFGLESVDFWAAGEGVPFYEYDYTPIPDGLDGTSFAAPQITAQAALHLHFGGGLLSPTEVIDLINLYGTPALWEDEEFVKYHKYYLMMVE